MEYIDFYKLYWLIYRLFANNTELMEKAFEKSLMSG